MNRLTLLSIFLLTVACVKNKVETQLLLPKKKVIDDYFGVSVVDEYRYMENLSDSTTLSWYKYQNSRTKKAFDKISGLENLEKSIANKGELFLSDITSILTTDNNHVFYLRNNPKNNVARLFFRNHILGNEEILFDPTEIDSEYSINYISPNWNGTYVVVSLSKNDEELSVIHIVDVLEKKVLPIEIKNCWPSGLGGVHWLTDGLSFTYEHIPIVDKKNKGYLLNTETVLYEIGNSPDELLPIFSLRNNPEIPFNPEDFPEVDLQNKNDKYVLGSLWGPGPYADYYYTQKVNLDKNSIPWESLFEKEDKVQQFFIKGDSIVFLSALNAPNFKICKTSIKNPNFKNPIILVPESKKYVITDLAITSDRILFVKNRNGVEATLFSITENEIEPLETPTAAGSIDIITKGNSFKDFWVTIEGWTTKKTRYQFNNNNKKFELCPLSTSPSNWASDIQVKEVEVLAHDGQLIPLSIIFSEKTNPNGQQRVLLSGYGAYGIIDRPKLEKYLPTWIEYGGIYAVAHVRGGGEKGDDWYRGGFKSTKENTWKDFISCAEYLIDNNYTSPNKLAVFSGSAGGIMIGKAITNKPELFGCAMIRVGVLNTLRTETGPNGANNVKEFGTVKDSIEFKALLKMDSYHSITKGEKYPAMYLTAGIKDARVNAWEAGKFAARMMEFNSSEKPILLDVDFKGGHGLEASLDKRNNQAAKMISFALWQTGHPEFQN